MTARTWGWLIVGLDGQARNGGLTVTTNQVLAGVGLILVLAVALVFAAVFAGLLVGMSQRQP